MVESCQRFGKWTSGGGRARGLQDFFPTDFKFGGVPGGGMPKQGKKSGKNEGAFHVLTLEVEGGHIAGETGTVAAM